MAKHPAELIDFVKNNYYKTNAKNLTKQKFGITDEQYQSILHNYKLSVQRYQKEFLQSHLHLCYDEIKNLYNAHFETNHSRREIMKMCHKRGLHSAQIYTKWAVYINNEPTYVTNYTQGLFHATKHNDETDKTTLKICQINELCKEGENMLLDKKEIAKELNLSVSMINKLMTKGMPYIKIGKSVRFDSDEVKNWIKAK